MDLAALVLQGFAAIPQGVKGSFLVTRTVPGVEDFVNDDRAGDTEESFTADGVLLPMAADKAATLGLKAEHARDLLLPGAAATFVPVAGCKVTDAYGSDWRVVGPVVLDPSGGGATALYTLAVTR